MKKIIFSLLILVSGIAYGQGGWTRPNNSHGTLQKGTGGDSANYTPTGSGAPSGAIINYTAPIKKGNVYVDSTNNRFYFYNPKDSTWSYVTAGPSAFDWHTTGNAGTTADTNFIGTKDSVDFVGKTNNIERFRWNARGALAVGSGTDYGTSGYVMKTNAQTGSPSWKNPTDLVRDSRIFLPFTGISYFGKVATIFGNSIVYGDGATSANLKWTSVLCTQLGLIQDNRGIRGSTIQKGSPLNPFGGNNMIDLLPTVPNKGNDTSLLIISFGPNDPGYNGGNYDTANYKLAYDSVLSFCINSRGWNKENILIMATSYINSAGYATYASASGNPAPTASRFLSYVAATKEEANKWGVMFIDPYIPMFNNGGSTLLSVDGIHPNDLGHAFIANLVGQYLSGTQSKKGNGYYTNLFSDDFTVNEAVTKTPSFSIYSPTSGNFRIYDNAVSTDRMEIISNGDVGFGVLPSASLHVYKNVNNPSSILSENTNSGSAAYAGVQLKSDGGSSYLYRTSNAYSPYPDNLVIQEAGGGNIVIYTGVEAAKFSNTGLLNLGQYGSGTHTGTATYNAAFDASGNIIEVASSGGTVTGTGTANTMTKWTGTSAIGNSLLTDDGSILGATLTPTSTTGLALTTSTVTSGKLMSLAMTGTAAASNTKTGLAITSSGANSTSSQTVTGQTISVTNTGTTNTNVGASFSASGATNNYGLLVPSGNVGIGTSAPTELSGWAGSTLNIHNTSGTAANLYLTKGASYANMGVANNFQFRGNTAQLFVTDNASSISFWTNVTQRMTIDGTSGSVGIGTSSPAAKLDVLGTTEQLRLKYDASNYVSYTVGSSGALTVAPTGASITVTKPFILKGYTVATLPTGVQGMTAFVTDALTPTFGTTLVGGGAVVAKAFFDGTNWINE